MYRDVLTRAAAVTDYDRDHAIRGRFRRPVLPAQRLTLVGYQARRPGRIDFDVVNPEGQTVFSDGLFAFNPSPRARGDRSRDDCQTRAETVPTAKDLSSQSVQV